MSKKEGSNGDWENLLIQYLLNSYYVQHSGDTGMSKKKVLSSWDLHCSGEVRDKTINKYVKLVIRAMKKSKAE